MTADLAAQYAAVAADYAEAYLPAINPDTRTKGKIAAKNMAKDALRTATFNLTKVIDGTRA